jgi:RNA polymerase sigma-70 factor (sigma-E family)
MTRIAHTGSRLPGDTVLVPATLVLTLLAVSVAGRWSLDGAMADRVRGFARSAATERGCRVSSGAVGRDEKPGVVAMYRDRYPSMVRLAWLLTGSSPVAEELVQDVFVRLLARERSVDHPDAYLRTSVINACRNERRRRDLERRRQPAPEMDRELEVDHLRSALAMLPWPQRAAIVLRYYEDLSEAEIADILGCAPGTVKSHLHRGLSRMREVVER